MVKNPENYVSAIAWDARNAAIAAEILALSPSPTTGGSIPAEKVAEVQSHLSTANSLFLNRRYQPAIDEYKLVQGLIYNLITPRFNPWDALRAGVVMPVSKAVLDHILDASMEILDRLPLPPDDPLVGVGPLDDVGDALKRYTGLGIRVAEKLPESALQDSQLGAVYAERGQWERAAFHYLRAGQTLSQSNGAPGDVAAQMLNLGAALVQGGKPQEALGPLKRAAEGFAQAGDLVGQAQASYNIAAALTRDGKAQEAARFLTEGDQFLARAQERPAGAAAGATSGATSGRASGPALDETTRLSGFSARMSPSLFEGTAAARRVEAAQPLAFSVDPGALDGLTSAQGRAVTFRMAGNAAGWTVQPVQTRAETAQKTFTKSMAFIAGGEPVVMEWKAGTAAPKSQVMAAIYDKRIAETSVIALNPGLYEAANTTLYLTHLYGYVIPVALGDCYNGLGEFNTAETYYLQAANYQYINLSLEVPALWQKLARNVLNWGDSLYKADEFQNALDVYRKVLNVPGATPVVEPNAPLYQHAKLKATGDAVRAMLENYDTLGVGALNPMLASVVLEIRARLLQLAAGLDFLGMLSSYVPIWTFDFLQNVARYFAQKASQAERDYINFRDRAESEELTKLQLQQQVQLAQAERELARQQREAAEAERAAYQAARTLAQTRTNNAVANRSDYSSMSWEKIWLDRSSAWYTSQNTWELENAIEGSGPDAGRHIHEVVADNAQRRAEITRNYELATMDRQITEMQQAEAVAQGQLNAAQGRVEAAQQMEVVANLRITAAQQSLAEFNSQLFTPGVWHQMANFMWSIAQNYFLMALRVARLMQRAYNFENDADRHIIRTDYSSLTVVGLLAPDALLRDVDSFTYDLITTSEHKAMPVRQTISLAGSYPFLFETEFRQKGRMTFETRLEDFDVAYPGTYAQRIDAVEVAVEGVLPEHGLRGALTNGGISRYRTLTSTIKYRVQPKETLVLSEYSIRGDTIVFRQDEARLKVFEGAGTAGTWTIDFPPASNDIDYRWITDIRLTFYYKARYNPGLAATVMADLATLAGNTQVARSLPLRYTHPDVFFHFQATGQFALTLTPLDFPYNHTDPQIDHVALIVATEPGTDPSGWTVRLGTPGHPATIGASPNAQGQIASGGGHAWDPLNTGLATGDYLIEIRADENPALVENGALKLGKIRNLVLILEYTYTPRA
ncbi:MAG: hypothetical protein IT323_19505 [Anaerolineae bacterium]|nr:hypothetical protein [Anaerolineae bacterium]